METTYGFKEKMEEFKCNGERGKLNGREKVGWSILKLLAGFDVKPAIYKIVVEKWRTGAEKVSVVLIPDPEDLLTKARLKHRKPRDAG